MNASDLPPPAKLAVLIEAGRAANPDLTHGRGVLLSQTEKFACALGFAALGCGAARKDVRESGMFGNSVLPQFPFHLRGQVAAVNDLGLTLDEICTSLREGELAKVTA